MRVQVVLVYCRLREDVNWHFHVFETIHWCPQVEVFDIQT